jgi:hypothetical protein
MVYMGADSELRFRTIQNQPKDISDFPKEDFNFDNGGHHMRIASKTFLLQTGIIAMGISIGATAMYTWQARAGKIEAVATGSMSSLIQQLHNSAHIGNLPVQVIEGHI